MSGHYWYDDEDDYTNDEGTNNEEGGSPFIVPDYGIPVPTYTSSLSYTLPDYMSPPSIPQQPQFYMSIDPLQVLRSQPQYIPVAAPSLPQQQQQPNWAYSTTTTQQQLFPLSSQPQPTAPVHPYAQWSAQGTSAFPQYIDPMATVLQQQPVAGPSTYLSPPLAGPSQPRVHRTSSVASRTSSVGYNTDNSRGESPNAAEMAKWGIRNLDGTWSCSYSGCTSASRFLRGCDLRKHYKRHTKSLFCRYEGCQQSTVAGFSSKKDRLRHEAKHNPSVPCEWNGCTRTFSRVDNMKDHVRRVHLKHSS